jgi:hypothetical protein
LRAALLRGHRDAACEIEETWRSGEYGAPALDTEHDLIAFGETEGVANSLRHRQLTLR